MLYCVKQISLLSMSQQLTQSESRIILHEQNQFLAEYLQYQSCPFCSRSFFRGKLSYHLKHCSLQNPMVKSNKSSPRHVKNSLSAGTSYERCLKCNSRIPKYLIDKHTAGCSRQQQNSAKRDIVHELSARKQDKIEHTIFPRISQSPVQVSKTMMVKSFGPKTIRIREELRCMKIAEQVQKVQCSHCGRKFSQAASQRHIPICSQLKQKQLREACSQTKAKRARIRDLQKSKKLIIHRSNRSQVSKNLDAEIQKYKSVINQNRNPQQNRVQVNETIKIDGGSKDSY